MSVIFGILRPSDQRVTSDELLRMGAATERFASSCTAVETSGRAGMGFQGFHTTVRAFSDDQPRQDGLGNLIEFDGRLDNYYELQTALGIESRPAPDSAIVLEAFERWGEQCFSRLVGDWALVLWSAVDDTLYLARDHAGARTLYFQSDQGLLRWSTYLETFFTGSTSIALEEDYVARYLCSQHFNDFTPYRGVLSVRPAHFLTVRNGQVVERAHWQWIATEQVRYRSDSEYEEHFLSLFRQSVARRIVPGPPILAQLSGGVDSSSIVCMADQVSALDESTHQSVDTVSYYDDSEPNWDERPYFSIVEARRGKEGLHLDVSSTPSTVEPHTGDGLPCLLPGADSSTLERETQFNNLVALRDYRAVLSGVGGDEMLGGVPTALPELGDYLASGDVRRLLKQTVEWCIPSVTPYGTMLFNTARFICGLYFPSRIDTKVIPPWVTDKLLRRCNTIERPVLGEVALFRAKPSAINNGVVWWSTIASLPHLQTALLKRYEYRYPYLDRDLVDFLFRIPREQLVRPGRRRSLMRRALRSIVPDEILERRRKAFRLRGPVTLIQSSQDQIRTLFSKSIAVDQGWIDRDRFSLALDMVVTGKDAKWMRAISRAIAFELWLQNITPTLGSLKSQPYQQRYSAVRGASCRTGPEAQTTNFGLARVLLIHK